MIKCHVNKKRKVNILGVKSYKEQKTLILTRPLLIAHVDTSHVLLSHCRVIKSTLSHAATALAAGMV